MLYSAVLIIPAGLKPQADAVGEAMGWGPVSYTIPLGDGAVVTHYAGRADVTGAFIRWVRGLEPLPEGMEPAQPVIDALIADFRPDPTYEGEEPAPLRWGRAHLETVMDEQGLQFTRLSPVDVNAADAAVLVARLPGVGASLAQSVIAGRPWADPADLAQVSGISAAMVAAWQEAPGLVT